MANKSIGFIACLRSRTKKNCVYSVFALEDKQKHWTYSVFALEDKKKHCVYSVFVFGDIGAHQVPFRNGPADLALTL